MGTWGYKIFENDSALDFIALVSDKPSIALLEKKFLEIKKLSKNDYLDSYLATEGLAAATIIASLLGETILPEEYQNIVCLLKDSISSDSNLVSLSLAVIDRIKNNSELKDLWSESNQFEQWKQEIGNLKIMLTK